jgi:hypothetical protein
MLTNDREPESIRMSPSDSLPNNVFTDPAAFKIEDYQ